MISQGFYYEQSFYLNDLIKVSVYHKTKAIKTIYSFKKHYRITSNVPNSQTKIHNAKHKHGGR